MSSKANDILNSATELFAAKGYHATSVSEIASNANANKATIYYHFKSKQDILERIISDFINSFIQHTQQAVNSSEPELDVNEIISLVCANNTLDSKSAHVYSQVIDSIIEPILSFLESKKEVVRIMLAQSATEQGGSSLLFKLSDIISNGGEIVVGQLSSGLILDSELLIIKFFGAIIPLAYYTICKEDWCAHYNMSDNELRHGLGTLFRTEIIGFLHLCLPVFKKNEDCK